jgi:hypothetical protein
MYGGMDRSVLSELKAADDKLIEGTTREFGSREKASAAFVERGFLGWGHGFLGWGQA